MPPLIPFGFGNRCPDAFGNVHTRFDDKGLTVFRDPHGYRGRHRAPQPLHPLVKLGLRWEGIYV